jgi:hypothetical protein
MNADLILLAVAALVTAVYVVGAIHAGEGKW